MKPGEVYVEPVLIGFATLLIAAMMGSRELESWLLTVSTGELAAALAASYFVGIIVDRLGDAVLDPLNQHHRLLFALDEMERPEKPRGRDPFPEDRYNVMRMKEEQAADHIDYLRSRIRLMRAMVVLAPAAGVAVALRMATSSQHARTLTQVRMMEIVQYATIFVVCLFYIVVVILRCGKSPLPRTDQLTNPARLKDYRKDYLQGCSHHVPFATFAMRNERLWDVVVALAVLAGAVAAYGVSMVAGLIVGGLAVLV